jgi:hypothetical protein
MPFILRTYRLVAALYALLLFTTTPSLQAQSLTAISLEVEAYSVLSEALEAFVRGEDPVTVSIVRFTKRPGEGSLNCVVEYAKKTPPLQSAVDDLRRRNFLKFSIEPNFDLPFKYELADEMEEMAHGTHHLGKIRLSSYEKRWRN